MRSHEWTDELTGRLVTATEDGVISNGDGWTIGLRNRASAREILRLAGRVRELEAAIAPGFIVRLRERVAELEERLARVDALLASEEPPGGLNVALYEQMTETYGQAAWRWFRNQLTPPPSTPERERPRSGP